MIAVIVETRLMPGLPSIIERHMRHLPGTQLWFFTDYVGWRFYKDKVNAEFREVSPINSLNDYNRLLTTQEFWAMMPNEKALFLQHDSMMLRPGIEEFLEFDLIGAPWKFQHHGSNGGFSLRSPLVMQHICKDFKWNLSLGYEDVFFSNIMHKHDIGELAPREVCRKFSCETIFELGTLGCHAINKYMTPQQVNQIMTQYD